MMRQFLETLSSMRGFLLGAMLLSVPLLIIEAANHAGFVIGNASPSVPRGLYLKGSPDRASHVTFCLNTPHRGILADPDLCSPDTADAPQILKRIATRDADGSLTVQGDTPWPSTATISEPYDRKTSGTGGYRGSLKDPPPSATGRHNHGRQTIPQTQDARPQRNSG